MIVAAAATCDARALKLKIETETTTPLTIVVFLFIMTPLLSNERTRKSPERASVRGLVAETVPKQSKRIL